MRQTPLLPTDNFVGRPRVLIISDIGNEPDDQMSLVRLLLYSNQLDIEGLVASTSTWQSKALHPETMRALLEAYGRVRPNLLLHAAGWPTTEDLNNRVYSGQLNVQWQYTLSMTVVTMIPVVIVFIFLQRYITSGIAGQGIK